jgi:hypothetical protein
LHQALVLILMLGVERIGVGRREQPGQGRVVGVIEEGGELGRQLA